MLIQRQTIIWANVVLLLIGPTRKQYSDILMKIKHVHAQIFEPAYCLNWMYSRSTVTEITVSDEANEEC